jgi:hypothetical protein
MTYTTTYSFNNSGSTVDIGTVFCDLNSDQTLAGKKQFSSDVSLNGNVTVNTSNTSFTVSGNVTVGNLNTNNNMYINGSQVATQSYITGLNYLSISVANATYATISGNNTFTAQQNFSFLTCTGGIDGTNGIHIYGGMTTLDGGLNVTSGSVSMCATPILTYTTKPSIDITSMGGTISNARSYSNGNTLVDFTVINIASVNITSPGTYLFILHTGIGMPDSAAGAGGAFWYNFGIGTAVSDSAMIYWSTYYEYIAFGNGPTYPIHSEIYTYTVQSSQTIYMNGLAYGIDSVKIPKGNVFAYGTLTAVRLT